MADPFEQHFPAQPQHGLHSLDAASRDNLNDVPTGSAEMVEDVTSTTTLVGHESVPF